MTDPVSTPLLKTRLSLMMLLQYAIWGAWLPLVYPFLNEHRGMSPVEVGNLISIGAVGALVAPFLAGQTVDRWFPTEKFLAVSHLLGAVLVWQLAELETFGEFLVFSLLYSVIYSPTISLTNSIAFHHLPDRDRDFGKVRVWGTVGWIAVGIGIGQWLLHTHTPEGVGPEAVRAAQVAGMADAFRVSAILGALLGIFCLFLPHTPPQKGRTAFAPGEALREVLSNRTLVVLFLVAFPVSIIHQFYFVHTAGFLGRLQLQAGFINDIFGVGGGGLMTIGQMSEILVLGLIPFFARKYSRKAFLTLGLVAYFLRFLVFAFLPEPAAVIPALALHGICFGCFIFVAFMIVDEETSPDVRGSAQSLFNFVVIGLGVIAGNFFAGQIGRIAQPERAAAPDYRLLFGVPMWIALACLLALLLFYPRRSPASVPAQA